MVVLADEAGGRTHINRINAACVQYRTDLNSHYLSLEGVMVIPRTDDIRRGVFNVWQVSWLLRIDRCRSPSQLFERASGFDNGVTVAGQLSNRTRFPFHSAPTKISFRVRTKHRTLLCNELGANIRNEKNRGGAEGVFYFEVDKHVRP